MAALTITPTDPLAKFLLPIPMTSCSIGLEVLIPKEGMILSGEITMIPLNWKLKLPSGHFGFFMPLNQQVKKGVTVLLARLKQGEVGLLFHSNGKEEYI